MIAVAGNGNPEGEWVRGMIDLVRVVRGIDRVTDNVLTDRHAATQFPASHNGVDHRPGETPRSPGHDAGDGRSPGLRVIACCTPSRVSAQWHIKQRLTAYSCGDSPGLAPGSLNHCSTPIVAQAAMVSTVSAAAEKPLLATAHTRSHLRCS